MDDAEFLRRFEDATLPEEEFTHRGHLRMAWLVLRRDGEARGEAMILDGLRRFTAALGVADKFHVTRTVFWVHVVASGMRGSKADGFDEFLTGHPELSDSKLPLRYYRTETLDSPAARSAFVPPDLRPL